MMFISSVCLYRLLSDTHQTSPWSQRWAKTLKNQTYIKWVNVTNFLSAVLDVSTLWTIKEWSVCMDCPDHVTATDGVSVVCWWWTFCRSLYTQIFHRLHVDGCAVSVPPVARRSLDTTDIWQISKQKWHYLYMLLKFLTAAFIWVWRILLAIQALSVKFFATGITIILWNAIKRVGLEINSGKLNLLPI